ncbi:MAG: sugar phosphate isomerase/epimerase family protein [Planctomycetota bacterium]
MTLRLAYNTNGWPQHELGEIARQLAGAGYAGIAITPDVFHLNPYGLGRTGSAVVDHGARQAARELRTRLDDLGLAVAVETGARFLLDPSRKHWPTLLDEPSDARRRLDYLLRSLELAVILRAETFSFWSGAAPPGLPAEEIVQRLCQGATSVLEAAQGSGLQVCLEPEPGMAVAGLEDFGDFLLALGREELQLMLDVGHVPVTESLTPGEVNLAFGERLGGVQLDDSRGGRHEHLFFGEGELDFPEVARALEQVGFAGLASVELPRHVADPVVTARRAADFWRAVAG